MRNYAVGESKCEDDDENSGDQNVNSGGVENMQTQQFKKSKTSDERDISNHDALNEDVARDVQGKFYLTEKVT